ncbi:MAG: RNA polymerase sigma factor [Acidobacteriota bacterium]|nr:RNA polymerase sigma factor [Acidobacteriota bacterium]
MTHIAAQLAFGESGLSKEDAAAAREARFTDLVRRQTGFVFRLAYAVLRSVEDAEDVVQETFLKLYRLNAWEGMNDERAFLARTAWRVAVSRIPRRKSGILGLEAATGDLEVKTGGMDPEQAAIARSSTEALRRLIETLPEELRQALVLSAVRELNSRQIAEILGVSEGTVRTRRMRARNLLKEKFAQWEKRA